MCSLLEHIPHEMREPIRDPALIGAIASSVLVREVSSGQMTYDEAISFIQGFAAHQEALNRPKASGDGFESKSFPVRIVDIRREERRRGGPDSRGRRPVIGSKYKISFVSAHSGEEETIYTGWSEFRGGKMMTWDLALTATMVREARKYMESGEVVALRKAFVPISGSPSRASAARYIANLTPIREVGGQDGRLARLIEAVRIGDVDDVANALSPFDEGDLEDGEFFERVREELGKGGRAEERADSLIRVVSGKSEGDGDED